MPSGAFLCKPAENSSTLVKQFDYFPSVMQRYARLYHLSPSMVKAAFAKLSLTRLKKDQIVRVYYVHKGEKIGYKVRRVPKGTPVFALPNGTPILAQICGNPLRHTPLNSDLPLRPVVPEFSPEEPLVPPAQGEKIEIPSVRRPIRTAVFMPDDFTLEPDVLPPGAAPPPSASIPPPKLADAAVEVITSVTNGNPQSPPSPVTGPLTPPPGMGGGGGGIDIPIFPVPIGGHGGGTGPLSQPPHTGGGTGSHPGGGNGGGGTGGGDTGTPGENGGDTPNNPPGETLVTPEGDSLALLAGGIIPIICACRKRRSFRAQR